MAHKVSVSGIEHLAIVQTSSANSHHPRTEGRQWRFRRMPAHRGCKPKHLQTAIGKFSRKNKFPGTVSWGEPADDEYG